MSSIDKTKCVAKISIASVFDIFQENLKIDSKFRKDLEFSVKSSFSEFQL